MRPVRGPGPVDTRGRERDTLGKVGLLALLAFVLFSVNFATLSWTATSLVTIAGRVLAALLVSGVTGVLLRRTIGSFRYLAGATFGIMYGTMYLLPATETVYVGSVLPPSRALVMVLSGFLISGVFSLTAVGLFASSSVLRKGATGPWLSMPSREWTLKLLALGGIWTMLFIAFGFAVYQPIARGLDPSGLASESAGVNAGWALLSQPFWGIAWTALSIPLLRSLRTDWRRASLALGALFAVLAGADMLMAAGMSGGLQLAHLLETVGESLVFGVTVVGVLQFRGRMSVRSEVPAPAQAASGTLAYPR